MSLKKQTSCATSMVPSFHTGSRTSYAKATPHWQPIRLHGSAGYGLKQTDLNMKGEPFLSSKCQYDVNPEKEAFKQLWKPSFQNNPIDIP